MVTLLAAVRRRTRRWWRLWMPVSAACGGVLVIVAHWRLRASGWASEPAPTALWVWIGLSGVAGSVAVLGWRRSRWRRRALSLLAVPLSLICVAVTINTWVGYFPTVGAAWTELTAGPLPDQTDRATVAAMRQAGAVPVKGAVVPVNITPAASHFPHRGEWVYLPPAWFTSAIPKLPTVMMIGGEFNTPTDWPRAGDAITTLDAFAAAHGGRAPVVVFVDSGGGFNVDTECVNGSRGNAADHLVKDVVPFMVANFGVSTAASNWGVAGFSTGGTCAVDLTVMHPDVFHVFLDIAGDVGPSTGTKAQTIDRLFGGSVTAWQRYDPTTVMKRHGHYDGISGVFAVSGARLDSRDRVIAVNDGERAAAAQLCGVGATNGIRCRVIAVSGKHDWPFAGRVFTELLPWLASQLALPGVDLLPTASDPPPASAFVDAGSHQPLH
jgi:S-formylglutathione hydrolase FrmB